MNLTFSNRTLYKLNTITEYKLNILKQNSISKKKLYPPIKLKRKKLKQLNYYYFGKKCNTLHCINPNYL